MKTKEIKRQFDSIRNRISFYGEAITGFATLHIHPTNYSDILLMVSDNDLLYKYDCYIPDDHDSISVIYQATISDGKKEFFRETYHSIRSKRNRTIKKYDPEEFFEEINKFISWYEKDKSNSTYYIGYKLYKEYLKFRDQVDSGMFEIYDWENDESLLDGFNQELWENANEGDQLDIDQSVWLELNDLYEKSDHSKWETGMITD